MGFSVLALGQVEQAWHGRAQCKSCPMRVTWSCRSSSCCAPQWFLPAIWWYGGGGDPGLLAGKKKNQRWTAPHVGLRFLFPPHQPHCSPPFLVQLSFGRWETGGTSQLPAHQHYTKVLLCLRIPVDFPLFLSPSSTFLKIGQESVSSTTFSK